MVNAHHSTLRNVLVGVVAASFAVSGSLKCADLPLFRDALEGWTVIPPTVRAIVSLAIPPIELFLGGLWLAGFQRRLTAALMLGLLTLFTGAYLAQIAISPPPSCGCLGVLSSRARLLDGAALTITRNLLLVCLLLIGMLPVRRRGCDAGSPGIGSAHRGPAHAFTFVEVLIVVVIVSVLLALSLPLLKGVSWRAKDSVSLSNLRSHAAVFSLYTSDNKDHFPYFTRPVPLQTVVRSEVADYQTTSPYFGAHSRWHIALADQYYSGNPFQPHFVPPGANPRISRTGPWSTVMYHYPCVFLASPDYYDRRTRTTPPEQFRPVAAYEVSFPSQKSILAASQPWFSVGGYNDGSVPIHAALVDGRAAILTQGQVEPNLGYGDMPLSIDYLDHANNGSGPLQHTRNGARGRDTR